MVLKKVYEFVELTLLWNFNNGLIHMKLLSGDTFRWLAALYYPITQSLGPIKGYGLEGGDNILKQYKDKEKFPF